MVALTQAMQQIVARVHAHMEKLNVLHCHSADFAKNEYRISGKVLRLHVAVHHPDRI